MGKGGRRHENASGFQDIATFLEAIYVFHHLEGDDAIKGVRGHPEFSPIPDIADYIRRGDDIKSDVMLPPVFLTVFSDPAITASDFKDAMTFGDTFDKVLLAFFLAA